MTAVWLTVQGVYVLHSARTHHTFCVAVGLEVLCERWLAVGGRGGLSGVTLSLLSHAWCHVLAAMLCLSHLWSRLKDLHIYAML